MFYEISEEIWANFVCAIDSKIREVPATKAHCW